MMWNKLDVGSGRPLILLHGIGMSHKAWNPIIPMLSKSRRVIAFDVAGFGNSPKFPLTQEPTIGNLVIALAEQLHEMGIDEPVDIVGNSMGGWMALEAARIGLARSVVAISPAGLWEIPPGYVKRIFFSLRHTIQLMPKLSRQLMKFSWCREVFLAIPIGVGGRKMPAIDAIDSLNDFHNASDFERTFLNASRFVGGHDIKIPLTIAFGTKDWLLSKKDCQMKTELPSTTKWVEPKGWGHVPMWNDPQGVAKLILENIS
ncbi:alpha/beta fold hydrolase [Acinetobacter venetianus]|uniref:alpha/beta fold hydrolase n=1 Tax=Acinetobacter venetianus TaxID=52133 RepID=UPI000A9B0C39|nr:alpha/beta hydrolase [Acinetobacter venetianus]